MRKSLVFLIIAGIAIIIGVFKWSDNNKEIHESAQAALTHGNIEGALTAYKNLYNRTMHGKKGTEAKNFILSYYEKIPLYDSSATGIETNVGKFEQIALEYKNSELDTEVTNLMKKKIDEEYQTAIQTGTIDGWLLFKSKVTCDYWNDADERIGQIEKVAWATEPDAWTHAKESDTQDSYERYLKLFPEGAHARQAEKNAIDLAVDDVFANEHSSLPAMNWTRSAGSGVSIVTITNDTRFTMTLMYSGPSSKRIVLPSKTTEKITLTNGKYRIAASVDDSTVTPFAGENNLLGGEYQSSYYIMPIFSDIP